ncbi:1964_t:CDS:2 [Ambispora gerdemannii]|uniref:1964_t:CDS:1 n=1 Tax=Ambispora gerdemannii TaxID=144530 RepID=A0A9N8ZSI1_9GLOM|nr:1964_t:CDS:2 [Ambispora gerdemannii]
MDIFRFTPNLYQSDVVSPITYRLIGIAGFDMILGFLGIWYSARAAVAMFSHLTIFRAFVGKSNMDSALKNTQSSRPSMSPVDLNIRTPIPIEERRDSNHHDIESDYSFNATTTSPQATDHPKSHRNSEINRASSVTRKDGLPRSINAPEVPETSNVQNLHRQLTNNSIRTTNAAIETNRKRYAITRTAAIRMILFSIVFMVINSITSLQTIILVISGKDYDIDRINAVDWVASVLGILVFLVFDASHGIPAARSRKSKLEKFLRWSRHKSSASSSSGMSIQSEVVAEFNVWEDSDSSQK